MTPLHIAAQLRGPIVVPRMGIAIDALLAWAVSVRDGIDPAVSAAEVVPIEIPVQRSECGRFHFASVAYPEMDARNTEYINRRTVVEEAQSLGTGIKSINISAGASKGCRIPIETGWVSGDVLEWWCIGDASEIAGLLRLVRYVGKKRSTGRGHVGAWSVDECEPWGDGFPVVRDGAPLRPLPIGWPGVVDGCESFGCLTYPYWLRERYERLVLP